MKKLFVLLTILSCTLSAPLANERITVNTGHTGEVLDLEFGVSQNRLFSSGDDGTLRIWHTGSKRLERKLQISHLPIVRISVHPTEPLIALIETDRINTYHLSVWNYEKEEELYSHKIAEIPLFLRFSPRGSYLVYGMTDWRSLTFLDAYTGFVEPLFREGFGIVSAAFISDTEKTLLTYSPSGEIRYWDMNTGEQRGGARQIGTISDLQDIRFLPGGRYLIAAKAANLFMIDLVNGKVVDKVSYREIRSLAVDPAGSSVVVLRAGDSRSQAALSLHGIAVEGSSRIGFKRERSFSTEGSHRSPIAYNGREIFYGSAGGTLYALESYGRSTAEASAFGRPILLNIDDIAFAGDRIFISSGSRFLSIASPVFSSSADSETSFRFRSESFTHPVKGSVSLLSLGRENCLLLPKAVESSASIYRFTGFDFVPFYSGLEASIREAGPYNEDLLLLEENGTVKIISVEDGSERFAYTSFGLQSISETYNDGIIAARNRTDVIGTPLLHINPKTGETVPIEDSNILTFQLHYDELTRNLYTLGYEQRSGGLRTVLKRHSGMNYDRINTLLSYPGEDPEASLAVDPAGSRVFTSLGFGKVHMYAWNGFTYLEAIDHIPRDLYLHEGRLYSLNGDSSISVWNIDRGKLLMTIYLFDDFSWAIVPKEGEAFTFGGADRYLHTTR